jgi:hypothetical protein
LRHCVLSAGQSGQNVSRGDCDTLTRSALADAVNLRNWRIYLALALGLIAHAKALYAQESSVVDLDASAYPLRYTENPTATRDRADQFGQDSANTLDGTGSHISSDVTTCFAFKAYRTSPRT